MLDSEFAIDVVVPWVDGNDPDHAAKLGQYLDSPKRPRSAHPTRYADMGELEYCVASVLKFTPWVRKIFIVTDDQNPPFFPQGVRELLDGRIQLVDHKVIFRGYEDLLPTFNSLAIETMIWRIPGLAEHFVYLNDDLAFVKPTSVESFFQNGKVILRGVSKPLVQESWSKKLKRWLGTAKATHGAAQSRSALKADPGVSSYLAVEHVPHPIRKSTLEAFFDRHPKLLTDNAGHRFRHYDQFWPMGLANQLELSSGCAELSENSRDLYLDPREMDEQEMMSALDNLSSQDLNFLCAQSLDSASETFFRHWQRWMDSNIGKLDLRAEDAGELR